MLTEEKLFGLLRQSLAEKEKIRRKHGDLMRKILLVLAAGLILPAALILPNASVALKPFLAKLASQYRTNERNLIYSFQALRRRQLIESSRGKLKLSFFGRKRLLTEALRVVKIPTPKRWDGRWRIVMFDIPNTNSAGRNALRQMFKQLKLYPMQKSVYVYPYPLTKEIDSIANFFNVYEHLIYLETLIVRGEEVLLHHFNL